MHKAISLLAASAAFLAAPAYAQLDIGGAAKVGGQVGINPGQTVGDVTGKATETAGKTVETLDTTVNKTVDATTLSLATREQIRAGAQITDSEGNSLGTVQSIDGDQAVIVDGGKLYNIPLSEIYSYAADGANALVSKLPRGALTARADASAEAEARTN